MIPPEEKKSPTWVIGTLADLIFELGHYPFTGGDDKEHCWACSDGQEGPLYWPCELLDALPTQVESEIRELVRQLDEESEDKAS